MNSIPHHLVLLQDLIQSEKAYIYDLFTIISRIAAVYTPSELPPKHLDHHFRLIESIFRCHKTFQQHRMPNTQQPNMGTLIHLFASLVQHLVSVYSRYCHPTGWAGRGGWSRDRTVNTNLKLIKTLQSIDWPHSLHPPSRPYIPFPDSPYNQDDIILHDSNFRPHASLTLFFCLPFTRLVYYRKLSFNLLQLIQSNNNINNNININNNNNININNNNNIKSSSSSSEFKIIQDSIQQLIILLDKGRNQWNLSPLQLFLPSNPSTQNLHQITNLHPSQQQQQQLTNQPPPPQQQQQQQLTNQPPQQQQNHQLHHQSNLLNRPTIQPPDHPPQQRIINVTSIPVPPPHGPLLPIPPLNPSIPISQQSPPGNFSPVQAVPSQRLNSQSPASNGFRASSETVSSVLANSSLGSFIDEMFDRTTPSTPLSSSSATSETRRQTEISKSDLQMVPVSPGVFIQQSILDLHTQLDTSRCIDIFTLTPKLCRLHLAPPTLAYSRSMRYNGEARFKLRALSEPNRTESGAELDTKLVNGRLILITDLLMFCEYMDPLSPKSNQMSLMFPPLAGKHLQVFPVHDPSSFCFDVTTMNKSAIRVFVSSLSERDAWIHHLQDAFEFCGQITTPKQAPNSANISQSSSPIEEKSLDSNHNPIPKFSSMSHPTIKQVGANQEIQSQPISPSSSHQRSSQPRQQHQSSSSIRLDRQLSQLDLSQVSHTEPLQLNSLPSSSTHSHPPSSFIPNFDSIGSQLFKSESHTSTHGVNVGFSELSLRSPAVVNSREQRQSQDRGASGHRLKKMQSAQALGAHYNHLTAQQPPMPMPIRPGQIHSFDPRMAGPGSIISMHHNPIARSTSTEPYRDRHYRPPSAALQQRAKTPIPPSNLSQPNYFSAGSAVGSDELSPESEDGLDEIAREEEKVKESEMKTILLASLKSKVFKKQSHSQWKSLGAGKIQVFVKTPGNIKQLVVFDIKNQSKIWISTIVLSDAVERVGRTGVAVDLSDHGVSTGIVYMLQLQNETSAHELFEQLLEGSDRRPK